MNISVSTPTPEQMIQAQTWPVWSKEVSVFPWQYDAQEICLIIEGEATVISDSGESVSFSAGDWVVFSAGLTCTWHVTVPIIKRYHFGDL